MYIIYDFSAIVNSFCQIQENYFESCIIWRRTVKIAVQHMEKEGINMNKSPRISEKSMHITLLIGSCVLAVAILVLSIAVGINQRREQSTLQTTNGSNQPVAPVSTTAGSAQTNVMPSQLTIDDLDFILPAEGALLQVHDLQALAYSVTMQDYRIHTGIDIETEGGAPVYACSNGSVSQIYADSLMGNTVVIDHDCGVQSVYRNLSDTLPEGLSVGSTVKAGQLIGSVGTSAIIEVGENPHLHFELLNNGEQIDPVKYLDYAPVSELPED